MVEPGERRVRAMEAAPDLWWMKVGKGLTSANVYIVRAGTAWALIDAGSAGCGPAIQYAAAALFGEASPPSGIFLTHYHPDHAGSIRELVETWHCPVWVHPKELELVNGELSTFRRCAAPLDRWLILPLMRLLGQKRWNRMAAKTRFGQWARSLEPGSELPGLAGWICVSCPGHTPGHAAFFRAQDRVLVTGDALLTVDLNSLISIIRRRPKLSGPPSYTTWDCAMAAESTAALKALQPRVVAPGHGEPLTLA
jgi:glyoxylase-like metal-dependent hydrolase (beta-lactamase superfamily II)